MTDAPALAGETALVTGASSGIGRATALELARAGGDVVLAARREGRLEELADEIAAESRGEALVVPTDVTDEAQVETLFAAADEAFGGVDVVVSNAGVGHAAPVETMSTADYRAVMDVNVDGTFFVARAAIPHLRESAGVLVFLGSFAAHFPRPVQPVYAASKAWTRAFARSLAGQVGDQGIAVTVVNPTGVPTELGEEYDQSATDRFPAEAFPSARQVAEAIAFAARQEPPGTVFELDLFRRAEFSGWSVGEE